MAQNNFPIEQDEILGRDYLKQEQAVISYHYDTLIISGDVMNPLPFINPRTGQSLGEIKIIEPGEGKNTSKEKDVEEETLNILTRNILSHRTQESTSTPSSPAKIMYTIPRRSRQLVQLEIVIKDLSEDYLPRVDVGYEDVYLGEDIVKVQESGVCHVMAINTRDEDVSIEFDPKELIPFEYAALDFESGAKEDILVKTVVTNNNPVVGRDARVQILRDIIQTKHLNDEEKESVDKLLEDFPQIFLPPGGPLPCTNTVEHRILLENNLPVNTKQYRHPLIHKEFIEKDIQKKLMEGIIEPSNSPSNSPIWIVPKKPDAQENLRWRMVVDFRELNQRTIGDAYPLPNITDILDQLVGAMYFSVFDLASGFHQIKTAFSIPGGHYEYKRMPMGLTNAPAIFQRLMDQIKRGLDCKETLVYMDDVIIHARSLAEHDKRVRQFFSRLAYTNLVLQPEKVHYLRKKVAFLGHIISERGVEPDPEKVKAVRHIPQPKGVRNIREFLGLTGYYRRFIKDYAKVAKPLYDLLKKDKEFNWEDTQETSFNILKERLCSEPILLFPDFSKPFILTTDASDDAIGAVLSQIQDELEHPVAYLSRTLNKAEHNYSTTEKECLAVLYALSHFRPYLLGQKFTLVADHESLNWMPNRKDPGQRLMRWMFKFTSY